MAEQREQYLLNQSSQFNITPGVENRSDLTLLPNPDVNKSAIVCMVQYNSTPLANALVKVLTASGDPVDHQFTNSEGESVSIQIPAGTYQVVVSAPGFVTSTPQTVTLPNTSGVILNVTLAPDTRAAQNTIYGLVIDQITSERIASATVVLSDSLGQALNSTTTDDQGEYLFYEIDSGTYQLTSIKDGYLLSTPITITVTGAQLSQTDIQLTPEVTTEGTVQGFIRDQTGNLLGGAFIALYSLSGGTETLVRETLSNQNGFYLFGNIVAGVYLVKAKVDIMI